MRQKVCELKKGIQKEQEIFLEKEILNRPNILIINHAQQDYGN
jgi:hypothetical protein